MGLKFNPITSELDMVGGGGGSGVTSIVAGNNIDVDNTDPANPVVAVETLVLADISDVTATATELNYVDGVTSAIQTQLNAKAADSAVVHKTGAESIAGVKTFSDDPIVPDEAYNATTWNGSTEVPTKNAVRDVIEGLSATYQPLDNTLTELAAISGVTGDILYADGTDSWTRLPKGTASQVLAINAGATAPEWVTPSSGGGQTIYDAIVAASGGTHTTLGAAIAAASNGWSIFVKEGTYTESAITSSLTNLTIVGENRETSIVDLGTTVCSLSGNGVRIENIQFIMSTGSLNTSGLRTTYNNVRIIPSNWAGSLGNLVVSGNDSRIDNMYLNHSLTSGTRTNPVIRFAGDGIIVANSFIQVNSLSTSIGGILSTGDRLLIDGCTMSSAANLADGLITDIQGSNNIFSNNLWVGMASTIYVINCISGNSQVITGNFIIGGKFPIRVAGTGCIITGNTLPTGTNGTGINVNGSNCTVTGNVLTGSTTSGTTGINVVSARDNTVISGNRISNYGTAINIAASTCDNTSISGNNLQGNTAVLVNSGTNTMYRDNAGIDEVRTITATATLTETDFTVLCNANGAAITVNLPDATLHKNRVINIKKIDASANGVTIDGNGSQTIDGATTQSTTTQWFNWQIQSDGSNWMII